MGYYTNLKLYYNLFETDLQNNSFNQLDMCYRFSLLTLLAFFGEENSLSPSSAVKKKPEVLWWFDISAGSYYRTVNEAPVIYIIKDDQMITVIFVSEKLNPQPVPKTLCRILKTTNSINKKFTSAVGYQIDLHSFSLPWTRYHDHLKLATIHTLIL